MRHVGFSMHDGPETLDEILTAHLEVDFVQLQVNYLDWDDPVTQSARCMEVAAAHGKPVIIMEPVRGGRLANLPERGAAVLAAADPDASQASWAYRYCLDLPGVLTVLAGASTLEQMQDNMRTFQTRKPLMDEERSAIDGAIAALRSVDLIPCTNCGYCVKDCPEGVKIPIAMNLLNLERTTEDNEFVKGLYSWQAAEGPASKCIQCGTCSLVCPHACSRRAVRGVEERLLDGRATVAALPSFTAQANGVRSYERSIFLRACFSQFFLNDPTPPKNLS